MINYDVFMTSLLESIKNRKRKSGILGDLDVAHEIFIEHKSKAIHPTSQDIATIMKAQNVKYLPKIYLKYLKYFGTYPGGTFFSSAVSSYNSLPYLKDYMRDILKFETRFQIEEDIFVFLSYNWDEYFYFHTEQENDNPPIYYYAEGSNLLRVSDSMTEWFSQQALDEDGPIGWLIKNKFPNNDEESYLPF